MNKQELLEKLKEIAGQDAPVELFFHIDKNGNISFQGTIKKGNKNDHTKHNPLDNNSHIT